jgi:hypothetical protein
VGRRSVALDPAVVAIVEGGQRRRRKRQREMRRVRMTLELNPAIRNVIREVAKKEGVSPAGVVDLFVADALQRYRSGELEFGEHTRPSRGPRYDWVVEPPL